jgi:VanZ family protein
VNQTPNPADAGEPALPGATRRPLQGGKALHGAQRSENDGGVSSVQGEAELHEAKRSEDVRGGPNELRSVPTAAWPLALILVCLVVYASLYPFNEWRDQGISPLRFLSAPLPQYWTGFDVAINVLGYAPLGFLLALAALRSRRVSWAITVAVLASALLSLGMEALQSYLPSRVPSNVDLALNTLGAWLGACCAWVLQVTGVVDHWSRFRARWFAQDARGALVLLLLWPPALLFPASVPLGLGQVFERLESALAEALENTPFLEWLPVRDVELQPLVPVAQLLCVALGALIPCLLGYCVIRLRWQRAAFAAAMLGAGIAASALSAALSYGPEHAWAWLDEPVQVGLELAALLAVLLLMLPRRAAATLALLALAVQLTLLNQAPSDPYFAQTLQTWEQGRFIRFHGVVQWLGWLWPYAALAYLVVRLSGRERVARVKT